MKIENPICVWDLTMSVDKTGFTPDDVVELFEKKFKKWCFQLEVGASGFEHYQCRVSTFKKSRLKPKIDGVHPNAISPTHNTKDDFYVMKEDTRKDGPWMNTDTRQKKTKQMENFKLSPWMEHVKLEATDFHLRYIDIIYDPIGNHGKSLFTEYMELNDLAEEIPPFRNMEDIFQWVYGRPKRQAYMVDMPRGMKKDKLAEFYSGIEVIKNGVAYDKRHYPKKARFDRPRVFVFTNTLPVFELLSMDRWKVWIIKDNKLDEYKVMNHWDEDVLDTTSEED